MNCAVIVCGGRGTRMGAGSVSKTLLKVDIVYLAVLKTYDPVAYALL